MVEGDLAIDVAAYDHVDGAAVPGALVVIKSGRIDDKAGVGAEVNANPEVDSAAAAVCEVARSRSELVAKVAVADVDIAVEGAIHLDRDRAAITVRGAVGEAGAGDVQAAACQPIAADKHV